MSAIEAAGALCWRRTEAGRLEVILVHRPRYGDWSWPKGKLEPDEGAPAAAVREVAEETGLTVALGIPLPSAHYRLGDNTDKHVRYWTATTSSALTQPPDPDEVDEVRWVDVAEAGELLSRRADRMQLQALCDADDADVLDTSPLLVLRHGHAYPRKAWGSDDSERPLVDAGRYQAEQLVPILACWGQPRVFSSPWDRCVQSVAPFVQATGARVRFKGRLSEPGHRKDPARVARWIVKQVGKKRPVLICTHRPVLGTVLGALAGNAAAGISDRIPRSDPFLRPGEVLICHVSNRSGRIVAVEQFSSQPHPS